MPVCMQAGMCGVRCMHTVYIAIYLPAYVQCTCMYISKVEFVGITCVGICMFTCVGVCTCVDMCTCGYVYMCVHMGMWVCYIMFVSRGCFAVSGGERPVLKSQKSTPSEGSAAEGVPQDKALISTEQAQVGNVSECVSVCIQCMRMYACVCVCALLCM